MDRTAYSKGTDVACPIKTMVNQSNSVPDPQGTAPEEELHDDTASVAPGNPPETGSARSDRNVGSGAAATKKTVTRATGGVPAGGDPDVNAYQAQVVGEESIGGTTPTPDQNDVEMNAQSVGVEMKDRQPIRVEAEMERRDDHRWELDPDSAEDH